MRKRVAVVAGVGPGLGAALVRKLVEEGCCIGMFARSAEFIGKLAAAIGRDVLAIPTDVSDAKQVAAGFRKVRQQLGPVEIFIANASGSVGEGLMKTTPDQFDRSWRVAVFGAFLCAREATPDMLKRGAGAIIFTGATSSVRGRGGAVAFSSAKVCYPRPGAIARSRIVAERHSCRARHHRWRDRHAKRAEDVQAFR
jgi:NAD(P)-dependent dehydrogenase (short-subunit alcohol dehydrogenase family)